MKIFCLSRMCLCVWCVFWSLQFYLSRECITVFVFVDGLPFGSSSTTTTISPHRICFRGKWPNSTEKLSNERQKKTHFVSVYPAPASAAHNECFFFIFELWVCVLIERTRCLSNFACVPRWLLGGEDFPEKKEEIFDYFLSINLSGRMWDLLQVTWTTARWIEYVSLWLGMHQYSQTLTHFSTEILFSRVLFFIGSLFLCGVPFVRNLFNFVRWIFFP